MASVGFRISFERWATGTFEIDAVAPLKVKGVGVRVVVVVVVVVVRPNSRRQTVGESVDDDAG